MAWERVRRPRHQKYGDLRFWLVMIGNYAISVPLQTINAANVFSLLVDRRFLAGGATSGLNVGNDCMKLARPGAFLDLLVTSVG
jgi:hypothetical protein